MKQVVRIILAAAAVAALAVPAMAADKLIVKSTGGTPYDIIRLGDDGMITTQDATGNTLFYVAPTTGRIAVGNNTPNAAIWLRGNVSNNIQINSGWTGTTTNGGGGGIILAHSGNVGAGEHYARANDRLGYVLFASYAANGTTGKNGGGISGWAEGAYTDTSAPTYFKFETAPPGTTTRTERLRISANGNIVAGNKGGDPTAANMATTVTDGFLYIPNVAGALTSCATATAYPGHTAIWFDATNKKICSCDAGALKCTAAMN